MSSEPVDFHERIDDEALGMDGTAILVMRGAGPIGYPGGAEVVNMRPPAYLIKQESTSFPYRGQTPVGNIDRPRSSTPHPRPRTAAVWR